MLTPDQAMEQANTVLAHAWMVRTFLKHSEEIEDDEDMLEVHRTIFDAVRKLESSYQNKDAKEYIRRLKGKVPKLRRVAEFFAAEYKNVTTHTNFEMASISLLGVVQHLTELLDELQIAKESQETSDNDQQPEGI
ncbi:MAG: hypothetical protein ACFCD0_12495 [Gemmataceae bacterium]